MPCKKKIINPIELRVGLDELRRSMSQTNRRSDRLNHVENPVKVGGSLHGIPTHLPAQAGESETHGERLIVGVPSGVQGLSI